MYHIGNKGVTDMQAGCSACFAFLLYQQQQHAGTPDAVFATELRPLAITV